MGATGYDVCRRLQKHVALCFCAAQIEGLPTIVFIPKASDKPALRTEGLYPVEQIVQIVKEL